MKRYKKFEPLENARLAHNYLTGMVDKKLDNLPYWLLMPNKKPAEANHCKVDDAELVGSWYEGLDCAMKMLDTNEGADVLESFRRHIMKSWGEHGLRYHEEYSWTKTIHSSFHEMGYILAALNRILMNNPNDEEAEMRSANLVRGLRSLVIERKVRTFWSGDFEEEETIYEFPNDVYLRDGGFDMTRHTGRGEQAIRNAIILHALVVRYEIANDETALDLAIGIANHLLGVSRYFNYKMEFFGHVHSTGWVASGLVRLGRVMGEKKYIEKGKMIYDYIRSLSSSFGWVPEYAQWHPMSEEHCETCCIKDMIECASELIDCGYEEYWTDLNLFFRNQLIENQIRCSGYMVTDNSLKDTELATYRDMDKRILGGFSGGSLPNSISLNRFRSIAGCCCGMAPVALYIAWQRSVEVSGNTVIINIALDKEIDEVVVSTEYPNKGTIMVKAKTDCDVAFRIYEWIENPSGFINGKEAKFSIEGSLLIFKNISEGDTVELRHEIETEERKETVADSEFTVVWRGCDVVDMLPRGEHLRLYQRDNTIETYYPTPDDIVYKEITYTGPTQQK